MVMAGMMERDGECCQRAIDVDRGDPRGAFSMFERGEGVS
jgi:hypothetical protein